MKYIAFLLLIFCVASADNLDLVRIDVANKSEIKQLDRMGVIINQVHPDHVVAEIALDMYRTLSSIGFNVTLLQENITEIYWQNSLTRTTQSQYLNYQQYSDSMIALAAEYPDICHLDTLGYSHQNRLLLAMKISDYAHVDEIEPVVHFEGNVHGNEKIGWAVSFCMINYLVENYATDTLVQRLVDTREIWIAPLVNPDGFVANSRYNANGVDLNRNWGWMWGDEYACGSDFMSENESWKFMEHFWRHPFVSYVSFHAGTVFLSEPWSYTTYLTPPEQNLIRHMSLGYAGFTGYPYGQGSIGMYPINGCTKDYDYGCGGEIAWSIEVCYIKTPPADSIDIVFTRDCPAMLWLIHKAGQGIHGVVYDSLSVDSIPLRALIYVQPANWHSYSSVINGDFHRFYLPGTYSVTVLSPGYAPKTIDSIVVPSDTPDSSVFVDIGLVPDSSLHLYATEIIGTRYVSMYSNMTYPVWALGPNDNVAYQLDAGKWIVLRFARPICDLEGNDLFVYRSSGSGSATVKISDDWRGPWQTLGVADSAISDFDITVTGMDSVYYVRIEASNQFMLDAVEAPQIATGVAKDLGIVDVDKIAFEITPTVLRKHRILNISNMSKHAIEVDILNLLGQVVSSFPVEPGQWPVSVSRLPVGVYFLRASGSETTRRFILVD